MLGERLESDAAYTNASKKYRCSFRSFILHVVNRQKSVHFENIVHSYMYMCWEVILLETEVWSLQKLLPCLTQSCLPSDFDKLLETVHQFCPSDMGPGPPSIYLFWPSGQATKRLDAVLVNKSVPWAWLSSDALEVWSSQVRCMTTYAWVLSRPKYQRSVKSLSLCKSQRTDTICILTAQVTTWKRITRNCYCETLISHQRSAVVQSVKRWPLVTRFRGTVEPYRPKGHAPYRPKGHAPAEDVQSEELRTTCTPSLLRRPRSSADCRV